MVSEQRLQLHLFKKENLQIESSSFLHISKHPEYFYSRITILLIIPRREEDKRAVQSAFVSRVFRAILPGRIFIPSGSKALQAPRVQFPVSPSILPGRIFILCSLRLPAVPCGAPVLQQKRNSNRISTCNIHSSTKVSGLQNLLSILCLQEFLRNLILSLKLILPSVQNQCF